MTMLYVPTTWGCNAMTTDMVEIMTSPQPMHITLYYFSKTYHLPGIFFSERVVHI